MKYLLLLLVALFVMVPACIIKETTSDNDDEDDDEDEIEMSDVCVQMLGCAELVLPESVPGWEEMYGEDSACWEYDVSIAQACSEQCNTNLQILLDVWEYPWECEAGAVETTNDIDTIDDVTWKWTVVDCNYFDSYCAVAGEWTMYTTFHGKNGWGFTGEKWIEHPTEDTIEHPDLDCMMSTDNYLDFSCDEESSDDELVGTFSSDWGTATAIWSVLVPEVLCLCEVEGVPVE